MAPSTALGFGGGALVTTIAIAIRYSLTPVTYLLMIAACVVVLCAIALWCPSLPPRGGRLVRLPLVTSRTVPAGLAIALAWAVSGLVVAVVPAQMTERGLSIWSGPVLFLVNAAGVLVQPWARRLSPRNAMLLGLAVVPIGYVLLVAGSTLQLLPLVLLGACVSGTGCYGFIYLGGLALASEAGGEQRARAVAGYFLFAYLGFGLPSILVGYAADSLGTTQALALFGVALMVAVVALVTAIWRERSAPTTATAPVLQEARNP